MTRRREQARARRDALKQELERRREAARKSLEQRKKPRRRRPWWLVPLAVLLLWMMVPECYCTAVPFDEAEGEGASGGTEEAAEPEAVAPPLPGGRVPSRDRPALPPPEVEPLPWLESFEMQVSSRAPRLAKCFEGTDRPGALRWTATVEASRGTVSDHELVPVLASDALPASQRACVQEVLSSPRYTLRPLDGRSTPPKVSLVIEF